MAIYIGVTMTEKASFGAELRYQYYEALIRAGAIPLALPPISPHLAAPLLDILQGLLLSGGGDLEPHHYGEAPLPLLGDLEPRRDAFELALAREAWDRGLPILAICRGMQTLNVALGGSIWQDISCMPGEIFPHKQEQPPCQATHQVSVTCPAVADILGKENIAVNSHHHQAVRDIAPPLEAAAYANDGVIEALWPRNRQGFCLALQWHPERLHNEDSRHIFDYFVEQAKIFLDNALSLC